MKKLLLSGAALVAMAAAAPAQAEGLSLDVAGHFKGYATYSDYDNTTGTAHRDFNFRKETEVHFTGETTLDNGLTVGVHVELNVDGNDNGVFGSNIVEESYAYFSGGWGRVNFGDEDGAAYLLQVAVPSVDSNVDGIRQYINASQFTRLDYDHAIAGNEWATKYTYMTPVFNGFQAGVSYTPTVEYAADMAAPSVAPVNYEDAWEVAVRYEGAFSGVGVTAGAGYSHADGVGVVSDMKAYNVGVDLDISNFGVGVAYLKQDDVTFFATDDIRTWVAGVDYQLGAYKLGLSYLDEKDETLGAAAQKSKRWTTGASYSYGPGMSFRGSLSYIDVENQFGAANVDNDGFEVLVGTQINF